MSARHPRPPLPPLGTMVRVDNPNSSGHGKLGRVTAIRHPDQPWLTALHVTYTEGRDAGWTSSHHLTDVTVVVP